MIIPYSKLKHNKEALDKYLNRKAKMFCGERSAWIKSWDGSKNHYTTNEKEAEVMTVGEWDVSFFQVSDNTKLQVHILSSIDADTSINLTEYEGEDIYNDPRIKFDRFTTLFKR